MAWGVEIRQRGPLLDGRAKTIVPATLRRWVQGTLRRMQAHARSIAPVLTGRYRTSLRYRTRVAGNIVEGTLYSDDVPGKVRVIEFGFPPRTPKHKGRVGRYVFKRTYDRYSGLLASQARVLKSDLVRDLS